MNKNLHQRFVFNFNIKIIYNIFLVPAGVSIPAGPSIEIEINEQKSALEICILLSYKIVSDMIRLQLNSNFVDQIISN